VNIFITMLIGGLWHGAGWTYVAWGGLHGLYLIINQLWHSRFPTAFSGIGGKVVAWLLTFLSIVVAFVPFRSENFDSTLNIWSGMIGRNGAVLDARLSTYLADFLPSVVFEGTGAGSFPSLEGFFWLAAGLAIILMLPNAQQLFCKYMPGILTYREHKLSSGGLVWRLTPGWALCAGILFIASIMSLNEYSEFLYFQF
jgi:alginate O-acetyltransferase complex protein AlgI